MENLEEYLSLGVEKIVKGILKSSLKQPGTAIFILRHMEIVKKSRHKRIFYEEQGEHIPPFLIASITEQCNLHCAGCYARENQKCDVNGTSLSALQWGECMRQAEEIGISFILLAGGEPFTRMDVLEEAGKHRNLIFPVFTNGTMIDESIIKFLSENPNIMPVISLEGRKDTTDERRGRGVYALIDSAMHRMLKKGILFGASITVTKDNVFEVMENAFVKELAQIGVSTIVYVEYVPVDRTTEEIAPDESTRHYMEQRIEQMRSREEVPLLIAFPGDEKTSDGCLAAGRGFFHINPQGGAEPCPFSPYSDTNILDVSLRDALNSPLFIRLRDAGVLSGIHKGGCVLYEQEEKVKALIQET